MPHDLCAFLRVYFPDFEDVRRPGDKLGINPDHILYLHQKGFSRSELARQYNCSVTSISNLLLSVGVAREAGGRRKGKQKTFDVDSAWNQLKFGELTLAEVAAIHDVSPSTIQKAVRHRPEYREVVLRNKKRAHLARAVDSDDTRQRKAESARGRRASSSTRGKISKAQKGLRKSPKTEFQKGHVTWNKGESRTEIDKAKQRLTKATNRTLFVYDSMPILFRAIQQLSVVRGTNLYGATSIANFLNEAGCTTRVRKTQWNSESVKQLLRDLTRLLSVYVLVCDWRMQRMVRGQPT